MESSLQMLLGNVIDYAGLFPPAALPLGQALANHTAFRAGPDGWLLGRFLWPVARLSETAVLPAALGPDTPLRVSVVGTENALAPEFLQDLRAMDQFARTRAGVIAAEALELRLPGELLDEWRAEAVAEALDVMATRLVELNFSDIEVFLEIVGGSDCDQTLARAVAALRLHDETRGQPDPERIGIKLRLGGPAAPAPPSARQLAGAIVRCRDAGVPLKFTAGLHEPLRHEDPTLHAAVHGFLNVFAAGVLAHARGSDAGTVAEILEEREPSAWAFAPDMLRWRDLHAALDEIELARAEFVLSFGSCSLDEPRDGLAKLGLL